MTTLSNGLIRIDVDASGRLSHFENLAADQGNIIKQPKSLFRAALRNGDNWEDMAFGEEQACTVSLENEAIKIAVDSLVTRMGRQSIRLTFTIQLDGDKVIFRSNVENNSNVELNELFFPIVGEMDTLGGEAPDLLWPDQAGTRINDVCGALKGMIARESLHEITAAYPGPLSMQWMLLTGGDQCLYFGSHDELFYVTTLRAKGGAQGGVSLEMNKMAFVKPGEAWQGAPFIAWLYRGQWHRGAKLYADWASEWRHPIRQSDWIRSMNGYFLVINKQQYGDEIWPYDTLPALYAHAQAHGFDALGLFGWYHTGHDNYYPDLDVSPTMGGEDQLKAGIKAVQDAGGHVTLYYQGHLMDIGSPYYKAQGHKLESKTRWGTPYYEQYSKYCASDFLRNFSKKMFSNVCPTCTDWHEKMADRADWIQSFGADGVLYDQIGGMSPYPCFDASHGHMLDKPSLSYTQGRLKLLSRIHSRVKTHDGFSFMSEHITDLYSQFLDAIHGIGSTPDPRRNAAAETEVGSVQMPALFRYCFPETIITVRNTKPYISPRMVNYAVAFGFRFEMELRYLTDAQLILSGEEPEQREYAHAVSALRVKYADFLLRGTFKADEALHNANKSIQANLFEAEDSRQLIVLWNDTLTPQPVSISLDGAVITGWESIDSRGENAPCEIPADSIMLLITCKN